MSPLTEKLYKMLRACKVLQPGATIVVACSGGADSLALTDTLWHLSKEMSFVVCVMHVQHHLRGLEAQRDARLVADFCQEREIIHRQADVNVRQLVLDAGLSIEEAARKLRYAALESYRQEIAARAIFLAHHRDDQAETVLLNLLRGAGTRGLRGMLSNNGFLIRPFLSATRQDMEQYCAENNIIFCQDSTNDDVEYKRNWIRKTLLPLLTEVNPQIKKSLAQVATLAAMDEECLDKQAQEYLKNYGKKMDKAYELVAGPEFLQLPDALKMRVVRLIMVNINAGEFNYEHVKAVVALVVKRTSGKSLDLPKVKAFYAKNKLRVERTATLCKDNKIKQSKEKFENEQ